MKSKLIRVGIFDQIVSGGGVRLFTTRLLEEFSRQAANKWQFHLMWPLFDSSNKFLPSPGLPQTTFERISVDPAARVHNKVVPRLAESSNGEKPGQKAIDSVAVRIEAYIKEAREHEQAHLRSGEGLGLKWLDERINDYDLIYFPYPYLTLPMREGWKPAKPVVITLHDLAHEQTDAWGEMTEPLRVEARKWTQISSLVIFSSEYIRSEAKRIYGLAQERTKLIYLAPPDENETSGESDDEVLDRYGLSRGYIFTLGWAARHKRVETIIEGFALFKKKNGSNIALVIAGPRTDQLLSENTFGLEAGRDLFALGYVREEDIPALYRNSSLVVTASISEAGLNMMIFDAMKYEKAIICSNISQFAERLGTDDTLALMFDPYSPESLADALGKHFADLESAESRIDRAKQFVTSRSLSEVGKEYLEAFESVL